MQYLAIKHWTQSKSLFIPICYDRYLAVFSDIQVKHSGVHTRTLIFLDSSWPSKENAGLNYLCLGQAEEREEILADPTNWSKNQPNDDSLKYDTVFSCQRIHEG